MVKKKCIPRTRVRCGLVSSLPSITREQSSVDREVVLSNAQLPIGEFIQSVLLMSEVVELVDSLPSSDLAMTDLPVESVSEPLQISEKFPILEPLPIVPLPVESISVFVENVSNTAELSAVPIVEGVDFFQNFDLDRNFDLDPDDGRFDSLLVMHKKRIVSYFLIIFQLILHLILQMV